MLRNLELYKRLVGVQIHIQLHYKASFWIELIQVSFMTILSFVSVALVLNRFGNIAGWTLGQVAFMYGTVEVAFGWMDMIFSGFDPQNFGKQVRLGRLDQLLLRPVSITVQVLSSEFLLRRIGRILQGTVIFAIGLSMAHIHWTAGKVLYLPVVLLSLVAFFGGLFIIGATITFWTVDSIEVINIFTYGGTEMMYYPMTIYQDWMRKFFTYILPSIFLLYYPALYFLEKPDPFGMPWFSMYLSPVVGMGVLLAGLAFWNFGLRYYQSTGT